MEKKHNETNARNAAQLIEMEQRLRQQEERMRQEKDKAVQNKEKEMRVLQEVRLPPRTIVLL